MAPPLNRDAFRYGGSELDLFRQATRWKAYWVSRVRKWLRGDVLEVGAGLGANTLLLQTPEVRSWLCLEPDRQLLTRLSQAVSGLERCEISGGTVVNLERVSFDCILYIDVLEHIEDDRAELKAAAGLLRRGGRLIVLAPAHQFLYSPFDAAIGHVRRYSRKTLLAAAAPLGELRALDYLDSAGIALSLANRMLLRQTLPSFRQILFWDRCIVPASRVLDMCFGYRVGKSVLAVWERP